MDSSNFPALITAGLTGLGGIITIILNYQQGKKEDASEKSSYQLRTRIAVLEMGNRTLARQLKKAGMEPNWEDVE